MKYVLGGENDLLVHIAHRWRTIENGGHHLSVDNTYDAWNGKSRREKAVTSALGARNIEVKTMPPERANRVGDLKIKVNRLVQPTLFIEWRNGKLVTATNTTIAKCEKG